MKKLIRWLTALGLTVALLGCGSALAAEESAIAVQLDGQALTFTDAVPQVKDERTFLPLRAVFEALGAEVKWDAATPDAITAVRDGKTLSMTLGSTDASVEDGGVTTAIQMDVAPYAAADENGVWRTYVPVRFAAQAFDCVVGWDQANATVIIVDTDKVVDEALEGKSFTYLEKLMSYSEKYNEGIWDMGADFDASLTMMAMPMTMSGTMKGTVEDSEKMSVDMNMKMDMTQLVKMVSMLSTDGVTLSEEDQAMLDALKTQGIDLSMRGDMGKGTLYMNMKGDLLAAAGMSADDWYKMDMAALMAQSGMDWSELMELSRNLDYTVLVKQALSSLTLSDSTTAYDQVKGTVEEIVTAVSDEGFQKEDDQYTAVIAFEEDGVFVGLALVLEMKNDTVTGYVMSVAVEAQEDDVTVGMDMTVSMDDKDQMTAEMNMDLGGLITVEMTMEGGYAPGNTAPATEPPAGANVVDFMALLGSEE